jgi:hypothetical protein
VEEWKMANINTTKTLSDGTVLEFNGSPDELESFLNQVQDLEKKIQNESAKKNKKRLLNEEQVRKIAREEIEAASRKIEILPAPAPIMPFIPVPYPVEPVCPRPHYPDWQPQPWTNPYIWCEGTSINTLNDGHSIQVTNEARFGNATELHDLGSIDPSAVFGCRSN